MKTLIQFNVKPLIILFVFFSSSIFTFAAKDFSNRPDHDMAPSPSVKNDLNNGLFFACTQPYQDINGMVVMEAENLTKPSGWETQSSSTFSGYTGSGYISWTGAQYFSTPGNGLISTKIFINSPGVYKFQFRSRVGFGTSGSEHNDTWVRFPDAADFFAMIGSSIKYPKGSGKTPSVNGSGSGGWFKVFMNSRNWTWSTLTSDNDGHEIFVQFNTSGVYTMEISARSSFHLIDRIVLHKGASNPLSLSNPETKCTDTPPQTINVTGLTVSPENATIQVGNTQQISANISPSNATNKIVSWSSSNNNVATVNTTGLVTALNVGTAVITGRTQDGNFTDTSAITVTSNGSQISIAGFSLVNAGNNTELLTLTDGSLVSLSQIENLGLNIRVNTSPSTIGSVFISLSGPVNASRTENGSPYALFGDSNGNYNGRSLALGNYTLTATPYSGPNRTGTVGTTISIQFSVVSVINIPVSGISTSPSSSSLFIGETQQVSATISPSNATNKIISWSSSNPNVADVNATGLVTALNVGTALITGRTQDGNFEDVTSITVSQNVPNLGISSFTLVNAGNNADIIKLINGTQLTTNQVQNLTLNIRVETNPLTVGSVFISISGPINATRTEGVAPYALFGDQNGNYIGRSLPAGAYTLTATAYSGTNRSGTAGPTSTVNFQISNADSRILNNDPNTLDKSTIGMESLIFNNREFEENESESKSIKVYPNPIVDSKFYVSDSNFETGKINFTLYSNNGSKIIFGELEIDATKTIEINFGGKTPSPGVYNLILEGNSYISPKIVRLIVK
jgi:uncharacterized protein YjdB